MHRPTWLAGCGLLAGPVFTMAWLVEQAGRSGYDWRLHPVSSLALGARGWMQSTAFVVTGLLTTGFALAVDRTLAARGGSRWAARFVAAAGIGLIGAGFFPTDPMNGYPPGTPLLPTAWTLTGRLHRLFSALFFLGLPLACLAFARRFASARRPAWALFSRATAVAFLAGFALTAAGFLHAGPFAAVPGLLQRVTITAGWVWLTAVAVHLWRTSAARPLRS
jgi:hypothetical membrane protein